MSMIGETAPLCLVVSVAIVVLGVASVVVLVVTVLPLCHRSVVVAILVEISAVVVVIVVLVNRSRGESPLGAGIRLVVWMGHVVCRCHSGSKPPSLRLRLSLYLCWITGIVLLTRLVPSIVRASPQGFAPIRRRPPPTILPRIPVVVSPLGTIRWTTTPPRRTAIAPRGR